MKLLMSLLAMTLLASVALGSGYGSRDEYYPEPDFDIAVEPVLITMKGDTATTCDLSKASLDKKFEISGCDSEDVESADCKCKEVQAGFSCVYSKKISCTANAYFD